ncbi:MAG: protein-export chaperone SecB [Clostridia bacterium]|nr:protein-export chaperone SecB [Clostridia bacterium]
MKQVRSSIQFENYVVTKMNYAICPERKIEKGEIQLDPVFDISIQSMTDEVFLVTMNVKIGSEEDSKMPFVAEVELVGKFKTKNVQDAESAMRTNGLAILYPYVRATLSSLTLAANRPPVVLPTINIVKMLEDQ